MAKGFIYVVATAKGYKQDPRWYEQDPFEKVPYRLGDRLYFGPCKKFMRRRMKDGDYVFGVSPSGNTRRILFVGQIDKTMSFTDAYDRFPAFRKSLDDHNWRRFPLEQFFEFYARNDRLGEWLGTRGPLVDDKTLEFFNKCAVYRSGKSPLGKNDGTKQHPIAPPSTGARRRRYDGLHLETDEPEVLMEMCKARMPPNDAAR